MHLEPRPVVLYVGQLIERKGVKLLIGAAAELQTEGVGFTLLVVGDGPEKADLQRQAEALGLAHIKFIPSVPTHELLAIYRSADVFVFPTLEDVWGLVVNEALWAGLPVLASIYAGCARELLPPENTFDPLNSEQFVAKLRQAVRGKLVPPDASRLKASREVADRIMGTLSVVLGASRPA
jgi:glycosyltransferase involved in cell wall biosynthesis